MATAHLIHGYIGAGKSTFARELENLNSAIRFSQDEWIVHLYGQDSPTPLAQWHFDRVNNLLDTVWPRCLLLGLDVVLDFGFWQRSRRDSVRRLAGRQGANTTLYKIVCPDETAWSRVVRRNTAPGSNLLVTEADFAFFRTMFEPLQPDEEHVVISS